MKELKITDDFVIKYNLAVSGFTNGDAKSFELEYDYNELLNYAKTSDDVVMYPDGLTFENKTHFTISGFGDNGDESIELPSGLIIVYGLTNSGKSELTKRIAVISKCRYVRFSEPELPSVSSHITLFDMMDEFIQSDEKLMGIDSFRKFIYSYIGDSQRAAGKGGISGALYSDLTDLSTLLSLAGKTVIAVINPMTDKEEDVRTIAHSIEGSVAGIIEAKGFGKFKITSRGLDAMREGKLITYTKDFGINQGKIESHDKVTETEITYMMAEDNTDLQQASVWGRLYTPINK